MLLTVEEGRSLGVIGYDGHLGTINAFLKENPVHEIDGHVWVLVKSRVVVSGVVL